MTSGTGVPSQGVKVGPQPRVIQTDPLPSLAHAQQTPRVPTVEILDKVQKDIEEDLINQPVDKGSRSQYLAMSFDIFPTLLLYGLQLYDL